MSHNGSETAASPTTTPPGGCYDCPVPPEGGGEWVTSAVELSVFPLIGLAVGLVLAYAVRDHTTAAGRSRFGLATTILLGIVSVAGVLLDRFELALTGVGIGIPIGLVVLVSRLDATRPPKIADRPVAWAVGTVLVVLGERSISLGVNEMTTLLLTPVALIALLYPLGFALERDTDGSPVGLGSVLSAMVVTVVVLMSTFVPLGGGPAVLLLPMVAVALVLLLFFGSPMLALGERRAVAID